MSFKVIRAILDTADLSESANFSSLAIRLYSWLPVDKIKLWWCLQTLLMTPHASNCSAQSSEFMPYFKEVAFLNSFSGLFSYSNSSEGR